MAEIRSDIVVGVKGADRAARELGKIKDKYTDIGQAARDISPLTVGGADPFAEATRRSASAPESEMVRAQRRAVDMQNYNDRMSKHNQITQPFNRMVGAGTGAMGAVQGGNIFGGFAAGLMMFPALAGGAMILQGLGNLSGAQYERAQALFGTGIAQRMNITFSKLDNLITEFREKGIPSEGIEPYLTAFGLAGGNLVGKSTAWLEKNLERAARWGVEPAISGQLSAVRMRAGEGRQIPLELYQVLAGQYGTGFVGQGFGGISAIMERALAIGAEISAEQVTRNIVEYGKYGGLSLQGSIELYNKMQEGIIQGITQIQTPLDVLTIRALAGKYPEMDISELKREALKRPWDTQRLQFEMLQRRYGGDLGMISRIYQQTYGLLEPESWAYVKAMAYEEPLKLGAPPPLSKEAEDLYKARQAAGEITKPLEKESAKIYNEVIDWLINEGLPKTKLPKPGTTREEYYKFLETQDWQGIENLKTLDEERNKTLNDILEKLPEAPSEEIITDEERE